MNNPTETIPVTLSLDTSAYTAGDVLADTQLVANALNGDFRSGILQTVMLIDKDDQGAALDLWILDSNVSIGTENSAPSLTDANAEALMGRVQIATGDYFDFGGAKVAFLSGLAIPIRAPDGSRDIYIAAVNGAGTPTYTASGIVVRLGILRDQQTA